MIKSSFGRSMRVKFFFGIDASTLSGTLMNVVSMLGIDVSNFSSSSVIFVSFVSYCKECY